MKLAKITIALFENLVNYDNYIMIDINDDLLALDEWTIVVLSEKDEMQDDAFGED